MWAAWKVQALDPVRLLMTLGASPSSVDNVHGNTPLHWSILARNTACINTLIFKGKASLDIPNLRGETPLKMLQQHVGAVWLGDKITERVKDLTKQQTHAKKGRRCFLRIKSDKRMHFWIMATLPFFFFYGTGQILSINTYFIVKLFFVGCLYAVASMIGRWVFNDQLLTLLPLSIYIATKVSWVSAECGRKTIKNSFLLDLVLHHMAHLFLANCINIHHPPISGLLLRSLVFLPQVMARRPRHHKTHHGHAFQNNH